MDICSLLQTMKLEDREESNEFDSSNYPRVVHEESMMIEDPQYQSDEGSECSGPSTNILPPREDIYGCAYLQTIRSQMDEFPTTGGEYVEAIFTHREIFSAHPVAHRDCARSFSDIASVLEKRAWRADREADMEAIAAFRHEAWVIASSMPPPPKEPKITFSRGTSSVCVLPPAY